LEVEYGRSELLIYIDEYGLKILKYFDQCKDRYREGTQYDKHGSDDRAEASYYKAEFLEQPTGLCKSPRVDTLLYQAGLNPLLKESGDALTRALHKVVKTFPEGLPDELRKHASYLSERPRYALCHLFY
jgi:hypothetical protein